MSAVRWWRCALVAGLVLACALAAACSGPRSGASATRSQRVRAHRLGTEEQQRLDRALELGARGCDG